MSQPIFAVEIYVDEIFVGEFSIPFAISMRKITKNRNGTQCFSSKTYSEEEERYENIPMLSTPNYTIWFGISLIGIFYASTEKE
tara:strand:+ start:8266 stop:8517 length:252 start_codon:yes stop_codon:yes gene_type:complete